MVIKQRQWEHYLSCFVPNNRAATPAICRRIHTHWYQVTARTIWLYEGPRMHVHQLSITVPLRKNYFICFSCLRTYQYYRESQCHRSTLLPVAKTCVIHCCQWKQFGVAAVTKNSPKSNSLFGLKPCPYLGCNGMYLVVRVGVIWSHKPLNCSFPLREICIKQIFPGALIATTIFLPKFGGVAVVALNVVVIISLT